MPNLVEELSPQYFNEFFSGALFLMGDRLLQVDSAGRTTVAAHDYENSDEVTVPNDFFTGYKTFEYPILGYRKLTPHKVAYLNRRQSTARGVRPSSIVSALSPASQMLRDMGADRGDSPLSFERMKCAKAFRPEFDSLSSLPRLLDGTELALVLSPSILIEPSIDSANDWFSIYYKQSVIGKMNSRGAVTWTSPAFASLLPELG